MKKHKWFAFRCEWWAVLISFFSFMLFQNLIFALACFTAIIGMFTIAVTSGNNQQHPVSAKEARK